MSISITRRQALAGMSLPLILPAVLSDSAHAETSLGVFVHGVASGDPQADSVVLWTRVSGFEEPVSVKWQLATDVNFSSIVASGNYVTGASRDYTVKVVPDGLTPGARYFYRFEVAGSMSGIGRTRTLPEGAIESLGLVIVSCSNYPFGYFNAYEAIALDPDVEFVLHLGDYLYEYGTDGWGGADGEALGRQHQPAHETLTLADYRQRHAQYKADQQSQMMHATHPFIAIWDDHETANNPWKGGAENHQNEQEGSWIERRDASLKAYFEWMPVREPEAGKRQIDYWRNYRFGDLANLVTLEARHSARSEQIDYSDYKELLSDESGGGASRLMEDIVGDPERRMLSLEMEDFLEESLTESKKQGQIWQLIGNPIPMARTNAPPLSKEMLLSLKAELPPASYAHAAELARRGELHLPLYLDPWDGYPAARESFYMRCRKAGVTDLVVLTGDSHSFWENALFDEKGRAMGVELGTSGVTSPGDFSQLGEAGAAEIDRLLASANEEIIWTNGRKNGYIRLQLGRDAGRADYISISNVRTRDYRVELLRSVPLKPQ